MQSFSPYDLNKDTRVGQLDLSTAQVYYAAAEGDPNWDDAKVIGFDGDGFIGIADLILILNHIVWQY